YFEFPGYPDVVARWIDLLIGVPLGAYMEEAVFRGALLTFLRTRLPNAGAAWFSIFLFALIHWGNGPHSVINAFAWGILPTFYVLRYRSIYAPVAAHFVTDFVAFILH